jgi:hypothetical protein
VFLGSGTNAVHQSLCCEAKIFHRHITLRGATRSSGRHRHTCCHGWLAGGLSAWYGTVCACGLARQNVATYDRAMRLFLQPVHCDPDECGDGQDDEKEQAFGDTARPLIMSAYHGSPPSFRVDRRTT